MQLKSERSSFAFTIKMIIILLLARNCGNKFYEIFKWKHANASHDKCFTSEFIIVSQPCVLFFLSPVHHFHLLQQCVRVFKMQTHHTVFGCKVWIPKKHFVLAENHLVGWLEVIIIGIMTWHDQVKETNYVPYIRFIPDAIHTHRHVRTDTRDMTRTCCKSNLIKS